MSYLPSSSGMKVELVKGCHLSWMSYYPNYRPPNNCKRFNKICINDDLYAVYMKTEIGKSYVAFRGSQNVQELINAVVSKPVETEFGKVHNGFWNRYVTIRDKILDTIMADDHHHLYCVGHSMGGCLALFLSMDIQNSFGIDGKDIHCYMYGSPASVDSLFMQKAQNDIDNLLAVDICNDVIPKLALNPIFVKPKGTIKLGNHSNHVNLWECHSCSSYYKNIKKKIAL